MCRKVLEYVSNNAQVLLKLNMKSMLNNWKMYLLGVQKYTNVLQNNFELMGTINFLCYEIVNNYQNTLDQVNYILQDFSMIIYVKIVGNVFL